MATPELAGVAIPPILRCALWRLTPECGLGIGTVQRKATARAPTVRDALPERQRLGQFTALR